MFLFKHNKFQERKSKKKFLILCEEEEKNKGEIKKNKRKKLAISTCTCRNNKSRDNHLRGFSLIWQEYSFDPSGYSNSAHGV